MSNLTIHSKVKLESGYDIPRLGFGVYQTPAEEAERCVQDALSVGYRHVDSAAAYQNEAPCGSAIRTFTSAPRSDFFFTSKVRAKGMSYESAKAQVDQTLKETGLDHIDLMLLHSPFGGPKARKGAWKALVEAVADGKVRSIGVSNYGVDHLNELKAYMKTLEDEEGPGKGGVLSVGQWEIHPWLPRDDIVQWSRKEKVAIEAYCPLVRGTRWEEKSLQGLAEKHGKTAAQVLLRWSLQKGYIPLPKSVTTSRIRENAEIYDFELSEEDMAKLETNEYVPCTWDPTTSGIDNYKIKL
ncbi:NADP-dependent oxidoreductase domain-containing protein [Xylariales sp. AK1849]|nr:NADP-dependent oxidoreductase domain-containing protein [Xylariales sp. AK1849]